MDTITGAPPGLGDPKGLKPKPPGSRPGHRKSMSDTFAFVAGQVHKTIDTGVGLIGEGAVSGSLNEDIGSDDFMNVFMDVEKMDSGLPSSIKDEDDYSVEEHDDNEKDDDPKRAKRIMANRQSAQRSRMRKMQYTSDLEKSVSRLHTEIMSLNPQVIYLRNKHQDLNNHNRELRARIAALLQETQYKDQMNNSLREQVLSLKKQREQQASGHAGTAAAAVSTSSSVNTGTGASTVQLELTAQQAAQLQAQGLPGHYMVMSQQPGMHQQLPVLNYGGAQTLGSGVSLTDASLQWAA